MLPILFKLGPITIYSFGFFLTLAYLAATFILWREGKRQGYNEEKLLDLSVISLIAALVGGRIYYVLINWQQFADEPGSILAFWQGYNEEKLLDLSVISLIAALVGGRIYYVLINWQQFADEPGSILAFWQGGLAYYGALFGILVAGSYFIKMWKWAFFQIADIGSLGAAAALVLGKIGTFLAAMDFGKQTALPWSVNFPGLVGARHPVQLYEATGYLIIFVVLYLLYFRNLASPNMKSGKIFFGFLVRSEE